MIPQGQTAQLGGSWVVLIDYLCGTGTQHFELKQSGDDIDGMLHGEIYTASLSGKVQANQITLKGTMQTSGYEVRWTFRGTSTGDRMAGIRGHGRVWECAVEGVPPVRRLLHSSKAHHGTSCLGRFDSKIASLEAS